MENISKRFTNFDLFGMFIPGIFFLYALGYMTGTNDYNIFLIFNDNVILKMVVILSLSYIIGSVLSTLGTYISYYYNKCSNYINENMEIKSKNKADDIFNGEKQNILKIINKFGISLKKNDDDCDENIETQTIIDAMRRILKLYPKYSGEINKFSSLRAISKSMIVALFFLVIIQLFVHSVNYIYYLIDIILIVVFFKRMLTMEKYYKNYVVEYFLIACKQGAFGGEIR